MVINVKNLVLKHVHLAKKYALIDVSTANVKISVVTHVSHAKSPANGNVNTKNARCCAVNHATEHHAMSLVGRSFENADIHASVYVANHAQRNAEYATQKK